MKNRIANISLAVLGLFLVMGRYSSAQNVNFEQGIDAKALLVQFKESARTASASASSQEDEEVVERCRSRDHYCSRALTGSAAEVTEKLRKVNDLYVIHSIDGCESTGCIRITIGADRRTKRNTRVWWEVVEGGDFDAGSRMVELKEQGYSASWECHSDDHRWIVLAILRPYNPNID